MYCSFDTCRINTFYTRCVSTANLLLIVIVVCIFGNLLESLLWKGTVLLQVRALYEKSNI